MKIIATHPKDKNFHLFEQIPKQLYAINDLKWHNNNGINSNYLEKAFVLLKDGMPNARVALYNNPHLYYQGKKAVCLGNFESVGDAKAAQYLLKYAILQAQQLSADYIIGPMNGSTWDNYRFSQHHKYANFLLEPNHPLSYTKQFEKAGFKNIAQYYSSIDRTLNIHHASIEQGRIQFETQGVKFRSIDTQNFEQELKRLYPFFTEAFKTNFLYTPINWEHFRDKYLKALPLINPRYVLLAEDQEGKIIACFFALPNLASQKEKSLIVKTVARHPDPKWRGLGHVLALEVTKRTKADGYKSMIHAFIKEEGYSKAMSNNFLGTVYKNYVLYGKAI